MVDQDYSHDSDLTCSKIVLFGFRLHLWHCGILTHLPAACLCYVIVKVVVQVELLSTQLCSEAMCWPGALLAASVPVQLAGFATSHWNIRQKLSLTQQLLPLLHKHALR